MPDLHLQALLDERWRDIALLELPEPERGTDGACNFEYELDHLAEWLAEPSPLAAASLNLPLVFGPSCQRRWPLFLDDLRPQGAARAWWLRKLNLPDTPAADFALLQRVVAPIGNLRIREAVPEKATAPRRFPKADVIDREQGFLSYAAEQGVQVGGATGAGGASPKLLLRLDAADRVWIDTWQDDAALTDRHYLVKFARGERTARDLDVLRGEYAYYRALAELEVPTVDVSGLQLHEGRNGPSLWVPRFDVRRRRGRELRLGLESVYALAGAGPGAFLNHQDVLRRLHEAITDAPARAVTLAYLERDLLNLVFGNSDNHGRNTSVLKTPRGVELAPIYDFAPMVMDPEGITRTTRWAEFELAGEVDWAHLLASFGKDEGWLRAGLRRLATKLVELPERLEAVNAPRSVLHHPPLALHDTGEKLRRWTLL